MDNIIALIIAVAADLVSHYIRKWLDGDKDKKDKEPKED